MTLEPKRRASFVLAALLATVAPASAQEWANPGEGQSEPPQDPALQGPTLQVHPEGESQLDVELGGLAAYMTPPIRGGTNPFGAGFGGRIGLSYGAFYAGISVLDFLGGTDVDVSYRAVLYGLELGYGVRFPLFQGASVTLRPLLGVGDAAVFYSDPSLSADVVTSASGSSSSSDTITVNNIYFEPALMLMVSSHHNFTAFRTSAIVMPGIQYGGADATTWLCYSNEIQLGFIF
jgi:hypothetical protein